MYIDNKSNGFYGKNGIIPSSVKDLLNITPDKLIEIMSGNTIEGSGLLPCPKEPEEKEEFMNYRHNYNTFYIIIFLLLCVCVFILKHNLN